jgi:hypothetical protein
LHLELALEFAAEAALVLTLSAAVLVLLDWCYRFSLPVRLILLALCIAGVLTTLGVRAFRRWKSAGIDELSLAVALDRYRPGIGQMVADVLQLPDLLNEPMASASPEMVRLAVQRAAAALADSDWRSLWNRKRTWLHSSLLLFSLVVPALFGWRAPHAARLSFARWLLGSSERWPQHTYLTVMGLDARGRILAPRDERFLVEVRSDLPEIESLAGKWVVHGRGEPLVLSWKPEVPRAPETIQVREQTENGSTRAGLMVQADPVRFRHEFPSSSTSSMFELSGGDDWLEPLRLERVDRPALAATRLRVKEPGSNIPGFRNVEETRQHLLFLPDTEVEMTLEGTESLAEAQLKVHPGEPPALQRTGGRTFTARWTLREATTLEILLKSAETGLESRPAFLSIGTLKDREPRVTLRAVGIGGHVTSVATIPLTFAATDDFGLAALRLQTERTLSIEEKDKLERKTQRATVQLPLSADPARPPLDFQCRHDVALQTDPPAVGTLLRFLAEADDRCARGTQTGRSSALALQVVSPDELFYEILIRQRAERTKFLAVVETAEKQSPVLAGNPSVEDFLRVMRLVQSGSRQLDQIAGRIADTLQEMKLNQIGSAKSYHLLQEGVIDPIRALTAGPMNALRGMLQALAGVASSPGASKEAARRLHEEVVTKMRNILDQMSQWESFVDVVNQVADVIRMEQKVLQDTEKARESRTKEIFDEKP